MPASSRPMFTPDTDADASGTPGGTGRNGAFFDGAGRFDAAGTTIFCFTPFSSTPVETLPSRSSLIDFSASFAAFSRSFALLIRSSNELAVAVVSTPLSRSLSSASRRASSMVSRASVADSMAAWATSRAASRAASAASRAADRMVVPICACALESSLRARSISLSARSSSAFRAGSLARSFMVPTMPSATLSALSPKARSISRLMARFSPGVAPLSARRITWIGVANITSVTSAKKPRVATPHHGVLCMRLPRDLNMF